MAQSDGTAGEINVYTSADLYNWQFRGVAYKSSGYAARPSMLGKNPSTGQFVLWAKGGGKSFQSAVASSPLGPFQFVSTFFPTNGSVAGDSQSFFDPSSGKAYYVYSQHKPKRTIKILTLDDDWTGLANLAPIETGGDGLEAPAPFFSTVDHRHYIWSSHCSGWNPNAAKLLASSKGGGIASSWSSLGNPSHSRITFSTQGSHVLSLGRHAGVQRFLYMGDRYDGYWNTKEGSRYIFLPMEVRSNGSVTLRNLSTWSIENWPDMSSREVVV